MHFVLRYLYLGRVRKEWREVARGVAPPFEGRNWSGIVGISSSFEDGLFEIHRELPSLPLLKGAFFSFFFCFPPFLSSVCVCVPAATASTQEEIKKTGRGGPAGQRTGRRVFCFFLGTLGCRGAWLACRLRLVYYHCWEARSGLLFSFFHSRPLFLRISLSSSGRRGKGAVKPCACCKLGELCRRRRSDDAGAKHNSSSSSTEYVSQQPSPSSLFCVRLPPSPLRHALLPCLGRARPKARARRPCISCLPLICLFILRGPRGGENGGWCGYARGGGTTRSLVSLLGHSTRVTSSSSCRESPRVRSRRPLPPPSAAPPASPPSSPSVRSAGFFSRSAHFAGTPPPWLSPPRAGRHGS